MTPELRTLAAKLTQDLGDARLIRLWRRSVILPQEVRILGRGPGDSLSNEAVNDRSVGQRHQPRNGPASIGDLYRLARLNAPDHRASVDPELADSHPLHGRHDLQCISSESRELFSLHIHAASRDVPPSPALAWPVARLVYRQRWTLAGWMLITALVAVFMVTLAHGAVESLLSLPGMLAFLTHGSSDPYQGFIATFWFGTAELLVAGFAVHHVTNEASGGGWLSPTREVARSDEVRHADRGVRRRARER
jgi:hypothetical protein